MPFKDLLLALAAMMSEIRTKANTVLKPLGPLDQVEAAEDISSCLRCLNWSYKEIEEMGERMGDITAKLDAYGKQMGDDAVAAALADGSILKKEDHETQVNAKVTAAKLEVQTEFEGRIAAQARVTARRSDLVTKFGAGVAAALKDEVIGAPENDQAYADFVKEVDRRLVACKDVNLNADKGGEVFISMLCTGSFDAEGAKAFDNSMGVVRVACGKPKEIPVGGTAMVRASAGGGNGGNGGGGSPLVVPIVEAGPRGPSKFDQCAV